MELPELIDAVQLHEAALSDGISITPGVIFSPRGDYRHHIRLSCNQADGGSMHDGVQRLGKLAYGNDVKYPVEGANCRKGNNEQTLQTARSEVKVYVTANGSKPVV